MPSPPSDDYKLALIFPEMSKNPELDWIKCERIQAENGESAWEKPDLSNILGESSPLGPLRQDTIVHNDLRQIKLDRPLILKAINDSLNLGLLQNISISEITEGLSPYDWRGPIVIMRAGDRQGSAGLFTSVTLEDLRHTADYFLTYGSNYSKGLDGAMQAGVKISCDGEQRTSGAEKFSEIRVPFDHPMFVDPTGVLPPITKLVEFPLRIWKMDMNRRLVGDTDADDYFANQSAALLNMTCDTSSPLWGWVHPDWRDVLGSVFVVREDRQPLRMHHVEALCAFCKESLQPNFEDAILAESQERRKSIVLRHVTRERFEDFYWNFRQFKIDFGCEDWISSPSPYWV